MDDSLDFIFSKRIEDDDFIYSIDELRLEGMGYGLHDFASCILWITKNTLGTQVAGHYDDCICKINHPTLAIRKPAVIQYLEKHVENIRMCLFYFIKQNYRVRTSSDHFRQLSSLIISYISWRGSNKSGH